MGGDPAIQVKSAFLAPNDDVRVQDYRHLSAGALRLLRAASKSPCHALASFSGKSVLARASDKSRGIAETRDNDAARQRPSQTLPAVIALRRYHNHALTVSTYILYPVPAELPSGWNCTTNSSAHPLQHGDLLSVVLMLNCWPSTSSAT